nr:hypothetical protein [Tanacetum cinerariifolium]
MSTPTFVKTHNLIVFLEKPSDGDGFEQIVDFLNANQIKYALTVSPVIYTLCIKQFWTTVKIKTLNDDIRLQALIDGKKVVITKASIRHDLKLNDAEGTSCLTNAVIFKELARMGSEKPYEKLTFYKAFFSPQWKFFIHTILQGLSAKTTLWNEFSITVASAIICLANNQKFNFSKYILDNLKKNLEAGVPFYMFPRFIQVFVNHQLGDLSHHKGIYVNPSLTKKVFANMKRVGTGFSRAVTPLFVTLMVQAVEEVGDLPTAVLDLDNEVIEMKSSYKAKIAELETRVEKLEEENRSLTKELKTFNTRFESLAINETIVDKEESSKHGRKIADIDADAEVITTAKIIIDEVSTAGGELNAANEEPVSAAPTNITTAQASEATKTTVDITTTHKAKGIVFHDMEESTTRTASSKSQVKDTGKAKLVEEPKILKLRKAQIAIDEEVQSRESDAIRKYQALKRKPMSVAQARKNMMILLKNMAGFKMDFFKGMRYEEIRPLFKEENNKFQTLFKEGLEMDAERIKASRKRIRKEKVEKDQTAKKQKVPDDEDDIFVNVTPLSSKPPTIMDYKIYNKGKKEHFQIIRANGNHLMYLAFSIMIKNFDKEDLEVLWKIVKDRFKESQPKEVLDVFLWHTLKVMFEHTVEDSV